MGLQNDQSNATSIFVGITLHACLLSAAVSLTTLRTWVTFPQLSLKKCAFIMFVMCLFRPIGILCGLLVQHLNDNETSLVPAILMSLSSGVFLHVTFLSLIPAEFSRKIRHCDTNIHEQSEVYHSEKIRDDTDPSLESEKSIQPSSLQAIKEATTSFDMIKIIFFMGGWILIPVLNMFTGGHHH